MKWIELIREQEIKAEKARASLKARIDDAWRNNKPVDSKNPEIANLIEKAKNLCHWNSFHVKVKDGKDIIVETDDVCMCPGKDFPKCHSLLECYGVSYIEHEEGESDDQEN